MIDQEIAENSQKINMLESKVNSLESTLTEVHAGLLRLQNQLSTQQLNDIHSQVALITASVRTLAEAKDSVDVAMAAINQKLDSVQIKLDELLSR